MDKGVEGAEGGGEVTRDSLSGGWSICQSFGLPHWSLRSRDAAHARLQTRAGGHEGAKGRHWKL